MSVDVLVIEDEVLIGELVKINLKLRKITCNVALTGQDGIDMFETQKPSVVLLDVRLPDIDGWKVCETLKQKKSSSSVIFMTAATQETDRYMAKQSGADDFIEKPFDIYELMATIKKHLTIHK